MPHSCPPPSTLLRRKHGRCRSSQVRMLQCFRVTSCPRLRYAAIQSYWLCAASACASASAFTVASCPCIAFAGACAYCLCLCSSIVPAASYKFCRYPLPLPNCHVYAIATMMLTLWNLLPAVTTSEHTHHHCAPCTHGTCIHTPANAKDYSLLHLLHCSISDQSQISLCLFLNAQWQPWFPIGCR